MEARPEGWDAHRRPSVVVMHAGTTNGRCVIRPFARLSEEEEERPTSVTRPHNRPWGALTPQGGQISHGVRSACLRVEEVLEMTDEDRIARLLAGLEDLAFEEREALIASLSEDDRAAVWDAQLEASEAEVPEDDEELGGEA